MYPCLPTTYENPQSAERTEAGVIRAATCKPLPYQTNQSHPIACPGTSVPSSHVRTPIRSTLIGIQPSYYDIAEPLGRDDTETRIEKLICASGQNFQKMDMNVFISIPHSVGLKPLQTLFRTPLVSRQDVLAYLPTGITLPGLAF